MASEALVDHLHLTGNLIPGKLRGPLLRRGLLRVQTGGVPVPDGLRQLFLLFLR